ncbi:hypothetical protein A2U01_0085166, partial [Trifolium medium]|nr:hypothetical protein [Trifolium medium]
MESEAAVAVLTEMQVLFRSFLQWVRMELLLM